MKPPDSPRGLTHNLVLAVLVMSTTTSLVISAPLLRLPDAVDLWGAVAGQGSRIWCLYKRFVKYQGRFKYVVLVCLPSSRSKTEAHKQAYIMSNLMEGQHANEAHAETSEKLSLVCLTHMAFEGDDSVAYQLPLG